MSIINKQIYDLVTESRNIFIILKIHHENWAIKTALSFDLFMVFQML